MRRLVVTLGLVAVLGLTGCGGGGDDDDAAPAQTTAAPATTALVGNDQAGTPFCGLARTYTEKFSTLLAVANDPTKLRASFGGYESVFDRGKQSGPTHLARNEAVRALLLFGTADHVIYPAFDEMAATVFPDHDGPHRLDECGHFVPWEAPDVLVGHVQRFCADLL